MVLIYFVSEDFINYKKPSLFIGTPYCNFKCDKECGAFVCQNRNLNLEPINVDDEIIIEKYLSNDITKSIVFGGLEPMDIFDELFSFIGKFRKKSEDDVVIYTGYYDYEIGDKIKKLQNFKNIIIKFGRFIPNQSPHYDEVLGVSLASDNQYAYKIS